MFSAAEILAALYYRVMRIRRGEPDWPERDRLVLSKGHVAVGVYPVLADLGFFDPALLDSYTRLGKPARRPPGHAAGARGRLQFGGRQTGLMGPRGLTGAFEGWRVEG